MRERVCTQSKVGSLRSSCARVLRDTKPVANSRGAHQEAVTQPAGTRTRMATAAVRSRSEIAAEKTMRVSVIKSVWCAVCLSISLPSLVFRKMSFKQTSQLDRDTWHWCAVILPAAKHAQPSPNRLDALR